jgi:N-acetylglucosaminyl-diphospho-decaprenol L-rhamnosyltransferase
MQTSSLGPVWHSEKKEGSTLPETGAAHSIGALTAVVVDWNLPDQTIRCVRALLADGVSPHRVVIVENGPTEPNWRRVSNELSGCVLVRMESNVGFAAANNVGARILPGDAYLLVNNDAFVHGSGAVARMLAALTRREIGIVVPRLLNGDHTLQPSVAPFTVPHVALIRASGLSRFVPNRWQPRVSTHWDHASSREIEAAIGAVMLVDGCVWDQLGGLAESAFMYAEDLDLCWRARRTGWKTWFAADAEFVHVGGASSGRRWSTRERSEKVARAEAAMIRAHLPRAGAAATLLFMRLGLAARVVCFTLLGKTDAAESCRGSLAGLRVAQAGEPARTAQPTPVFEVIHPAR